jgi:RimJ/RimL family protein N-acetyltransferase
VKPTLRRILLFLTGREAGGEGIHWLNFRRRIGPFEEFVRELEGMLPNSILLLIRRAKTGDPIGFALGYNINSWDGSIGATMYLEERFQKRGYGGEATLLWTDFLFRTFPLRRITAEIYEFATPTLAIVQAIGAEEVGFMLNISGTKTATGACTS